MRIYLARHGETRVGTDGLYLPESDLTERGHAQAVELATALEGVGIDAAFTSGLPRAQQTADKFALATGITATPIAALNEIDPGDIYSASPEEKVAIISHNHSLDFSALGGEDLPTFVARVVSGFDQMVAQARARDARTVAAFIHGGTVGVIIDHLAGLAFDYRRRKRMPNCSYAVVETGSPLPGGLVDWQSGHLTHVT